MHDHQTHHTAGKPEPVHVVLEEHGGGADLHCVRVVGGVFEEAVVRVEDLAREKEEEFSRRAPVVKPVRVRKERAGGRVENEVGKEGRED